MKLKSRNKKISEYNAKYQNSPRDIETCVRKYFVDHNLNFEKASLKAAKKYDKICKERKYETIHIVMYEYPMKTDRPRTWHDHIYSPNAVPNHKYFESAVKKVLKHIKLINTPATIQIDAYIEMPKHVPPDEILLFETGVLDVLDMPDYDNIGKCYTDMLKDVLITDDDIFYSGAIHKYYSVLPRVEIYITYLTKHESEYIYKKLKSRKSVQQYIKSGLVTLDKIKFDT